MILQSIIKYPRRNASKRVTMPSDACQLFSVCTGSGERLRPKRLLRFLLLRFGRTLNIILN